MFAAARAKYGDFNIPPLFALDDIRSWPDFKERRQKNKAFWDYGFLSHVPLDTNTAYNGYREFDGP